MKTQLNPQIWLIVLLSFILIFAKNLITGDILYFLHPKMLPYIYFALIMFVLLFIERLVKLIKTPPDTQDIKWSVFIFAIPIILSFNQPKAMTGQALNNKTAIIGIQKENANPKEELQSTENLEIEINSELQSEAQSQAQNKFKDTTPKLSDDGKEFLDKVYSLQASIDALKGTEMTIKGFVFRDESLSENQLVVARLYVSCCVADAGVIGVLVESDDASSYENETWIEVTGAIDSVTYHDDVFKTDYDIPKLIHANIKKVKPLDSMYVFE